MRKFNNKSEKLLTTNSVKVIIESNNNHEVVLRKVNGVSMEFVKVPRSLIYNKRLGDKRILAYTSLLFHNWESKKCDVQELALYCGYSLSRKNSDADLQFLNIFQELSLERYITIYNPAQKVFTFSFETPTKSFGIIYSSEFTKILEYRKKQKENGRRVNHAHLLLLLSYIRLNMQKMKNKPVMHFSLLKTISENTNMSVRSITSALKILEELQIIHSEELPRYKDVNGNWHSNVKVFVNMKYCSFFETINTNYDWKIETERSINSIISIQRDYIGG